MAAKRIGSIRAGRMCGHGSQEPTGGDLSSSRCSLSLFVGPPKRGLPFSVAQADCPEA